MRRIADYIKKYSEESGTAVSAFAVLFFIISWRYAAPEQPVVYYSSASLSVLSLVALIYFGRQLWKKYRKRIKSFVTVLYEKLMRSVVRLLERMGLGRRGVNTLGGRTTLTFDRMKKRGGRSRRTVKWRQLEDDRARLRYLYAQSLIGKIKGGAHIYESQTPAEVKKHHCDTENADESELFAEYNEHRYSDDKPPDSERLERLRARLGIK